MELSQEERLILRLRELAKEHPGRVVCLTVIFDKTGKPIGWWTQVIAEPEGMMLVVNKSNT